MGEKNNRFGSTSPDVETLLLTLGAAEIVTIDYNKISFAHRQLKTMTLEDLITSLDAGDLAPFDTAVSFSSFDHDGLGRYGDPLCPDGDLLAMDLVKRTLKPNGKLFLTVPLGADAVAWNLMRRYGALRLPLLLHGWETLKQYGGNVQEAVKATRKLTATHEPVLVLAPKEEEEEDSTEALPPMHEEL